MKSKSLLAPYVTGLALVFLATTMHHAYARGGGRGGFSRESPAAGGSFSSRSGAMEGQQRTAEASRQQYGSSAQASRQQYGSSAQASRQQYGSNAQTSRQQYGSTAQANREQTAAGMQSRAQQYHGAYPYAAAPYAHWDAGVGMAAATGAAIGAAAAYPTGSASPPMAGSSSGSPCTAPTVVPAGNMQYFRCDGLWYTQAYGPSGPAFVQVPPPAGF